MQRIRRNNEGIMRRGGSFMRVIAKFWSDGHTPSLKSNMTGSMQGGEVSSKKRWCWQWCFWGLWLELGYNWKFQVRKWKALPKWYAATGAERDSIPWPAGQPRLPLNLYYCWAIRSTDFACECNNSRHETSRYVLLVFWKNWIVAMKTGW